MTRAHALSAIVHSPADAMLHALPHPVIMVAPDGKIADANVAAEQFFDASTSMLRRHSLRELVPFGSPLLTLIEQVRHRGAAVNEYKVDLATPRNPGERLVDLYVGPLPEYPEHVIVMLQERTIADKMDRQLASRRRPFGNCPGCHARPRNQEPVVRHSWRRAASRAIRRR